MAIQFLPMPAIAYPQNAMINFAPMNQSLQFMAQNNMDRARFGLQQNADLRAEQMHPLAMEYQRAQTAGLVGAEGRAVRREPYDLRYVTAQTNQANAGAGLTNTQAALARDANRRTNELHPYQLIQQYNAAIRPADQNDLIYGILGMQPPQPQTPSPQPPWPAGVGPRPQVPSPAAAPQAGGPSVQGGVSFNPNSPTWQPQGPAQPQAPAAPAAAPPQQQTGNAWGNNPQAAAVAAGLATGRIPQPAATMLLRGPAWAGQPDSVVNQAHTQAIAAATAAQTHQATVSNVDRLVQIAPQAYVGANAQTRANVANVLQSLGVPSGWLLQNQSLPATQLLAQGLAQFIGTEAEKYKPISNSDITFIQSTLANPNMTREALMQALAVSRIVAQRHAAYEEGRAELFLSTPQAPALLPQLAAAVIRRFPSPVAGGGQGQPQPQPQAQGQPQADGQADAPGQPAPSRSGGTDRWRALTAQGQAQIIAALRTDPSLRAEIANRYGRDVLREILRAIGTPSGGPQTMSGY